MTPFVVYFVAFGGKGPATVATQIGLLSGVYPHVMPETSSLGEATSASLLSASKWLESKVDIAMSRKGRHGVKGFETGRVEALVFLEQF